MNTTYFLNCAAGNLFGTETDPAIPEKYYIGLSTTAPNIGGTGVSEPLSGAGYSRIELKDLSAPENGVITNTQSIEFDESTASWGTITHFVIFDAPTGGNLLMYGALSSSRTVEPQTVMTIKSGYLNLSTQNPA